MGRGEYPQYPIKEGEGDVMLVLRGRPAGLAPWLTLLLYFLLGFGGVGLAMGFFITASLASFLMFIRIGSSINNCCIIGVEVLVSTFSTSATDVTMLTRSTDFSTDDSLLTEGTEEVVISGLNSSVEIFVTGVMSEHLLPELAKDVPSPALSWEPLAYSCDSVWGALASEFADGVPALEQESSTGLFAMMTEVGLLDCSCGILVPPDFEFSFLFL